MAQSLVHSMGLINIMSSPLISLSSPRDVSIELGTTSVIEEIEAELRQIWQSYNSDEEGLLVSRATTFTLLIYEPDGTQALLNDLGYYTGPVDGITGPRTQSAIKSAQKAFGMQVTGRADDDFTLRLRSEYIKAKEAGTLHDSGFNYLPDGEGAGVADAIASANPCRIITLCPTVDGEEGVKAQVSASCPVNKRSKNSLICCEYITLKGSASALEKIGGLILELMIPELPKFLWWKAIPDPNYGLLKRLTTECDSVIVDSSRFVHPLGNLKQLSQLFEQKAPIADLNWGRLSAWQELTAEAFDPPERRDSIWLVDRITIDYEKGNPSQALMFLGWIASRLQWQPVSLEEKAGDYDIFQFRFLNKDQKIVEAELAGIPVADVGEIPGDLISLRLTSTDLNADCCTVLCSETTGCMRMEAGGGAQSCRVQQVTPLFDQNTEKLLSLQLQRWGQDKLYEESMGVTYQILQLF